MLYAISFDDALDTDVLDHVKASLSEAFNQKIVQADPTLFFISADKENVSVLSRFIRESVLSEIKPLPKYLCFPAQTYHGFHRGGFAKEVAALELKVPVAPAASPEAKPSTPAPAVPAKPIISLAPKADEGPKPTPAPKAVTKAIAAPKDTFAVIQAELDDLIGMAHFKETMRSIMSERKMDVLMKRVGLLIAEKPSHHALMLGPPGTGKTVGARILGRYLKVLGLLSKGHVIEVDRAGLVGDSIGSTEAKTKAVLDKAEGGTLFIDEAYSLYSDSERDFGRPALTQIMKRMEDGRGDLSVVMAGSTQEMQKFLSMISGLESRLTMRFVFENFTNAELSRVFHQQIGRHILNPCDGMDELLNEVVALEKGKTQGRFGNGRFTRNLAEILARNVAARLDRNGLLKEGLTAEQLRHMRTITPEDIAKYTETAYAIPKTRLASRELFLRQNTTDKVVPLFSGARRPHIVHVPIAEDSAPA